MTETPNYKILLKDKACGEYKSIPYYYPYDFCSLEFYFEEGNMSCDCNRYMLFYGHDTGHKQVCSDEERFELISIEAI